MIVKEDLSNGSACCKIPVVNVVDNSNFKERFLYVAENVEREDFVQKNLSGCDCIDVCLPGRCACIDNSTARIYDHKIDLTNGVPNFYENIIYECDKNTCLGCKGKCHWRLTPEKFNLEVEVFKTPLAGWAVRSRQLIEAGTFIAEFVGEIVHHNSMAHRPIDYAYDLPLLDINKSANIYVDPHVYGNITRFLNHSCFENLHPFRYYSHHRDKSRISLGFFASRDIIPGDELTIDYGPEWWKGKIEESRKQNQVCSCCCMVGMFCPRTALLVSSFGLLYFLLCLFVLVSLMRHLAGGRAALSNSLTEKGKVIDFRSPPFCCFLWCLPKARPSIVNLTKLEWIVLQAPIVRVFIVFGQVVVVAEARENAYNWLQFFDLATFASLLLAIFGVHTLARLTSEELSCYGFGGIFRVVDLGLFLFTAQQPFIFQNILLRFGVIRCGVVLSPQENARFICNFAIICELFLLSLFSTFWVSPHRNNLFDQYIRRRTNSTSPHRSRTSSLRSVKESRIDETETPTTTINNGRSLSINGNTQISGAATTTTQTTVLLDLD
uniref:SET domain-containing protein n=1 Tax=Meloidogyne javanica TaxID=6303 RepID=A0A915MCJ9_MELJA